LLVLYDVSVLGYWQLITCGWNFKLLTLLLDIKAVSEGSIIVCKGGRERERGRQRERE
jgi:hypothetical protein